MFFGVDYYPEHWPKDRWPVDARLMREAGMNIVRLAEFAWAQMEPSKGQFNFTWLEEALETLGSEGLRAVLGTPTASHPAWLDEEYPSVRMVDEQRRVVNFGGRQHACINSPDYRRASDRIVRAMAEKFGNHPGVYGWQIDNEFGPHCYCDICRKSFQDWLQKRYGTLDGLNSAWGTEFWGHIYSKWSQIPLPWIPPGSHNPGLSLDYKRFMSGSYSSFAKRQAKIIRGASGRPITHNFMGYWPEVLDYHAIADPLDWASWDNYPMFGAGSTRAMTSMGHDIVRGYKGRNFWVMEQQSGPCGWARMEPSPRPGRVRMYTYHSIAHGADGIIYFRWRVCRTGIEQYSHGILDHDGSVNRRYEEIKSVGAEMEKLAPLLEGTTVKAEAAFINDYESRWVWQDQPTNIELSYTAEAENYYKQLNDRNVPVDILEVGSDISAYKLVIVPLMYIIRPDVARQLRRYVETGGTLIVTFRTAAKDQTNAMANEPLPAMLREVFGVRVAEYHSPYKDENNFIKGVAESLPSEPTKASVFLDVLEPDGAEILAEYADGFASGRPAVTMNYFGKGRAVYVGTHIEDDFASSLMEMLMKKSGIAPGPASPEGVEIAIRRSEDRELLFVMNFTGETKVVDPPAGAKVVIGPEESGKIALEPYGVRVYQRQLVAQ